MLACRNQSGGEGVDDTTRELMHRMHELSRSLRLIKHHGVEQSTVSAALLPVLRHIAEPAGGCLGRDLAARTRLDPSTISRAVTALVAHGWVERGADPSDGRAHVLTVTAAGRAALRDAQQQYGRLLQRALAGWSPADVAALSEALGRLTADIDRTLGHHDTLEAAR